MQRIFHCTYYYDILFYWKKLLESTKFDVSTFFFFLTNNIFFWIYTFIPIKFLLQFLSMDIFLWNFLQSESVRFICFMVSTSRSFSPICKLLLCNNSFFLMNFTTNFVLMDYLLKTSQKTFFKKWKVIERNSS